MYPHTIVLPTPMGGGAVPTLAGLDVPLPDAPAKRSRKTAWVISAILGCCLIVMCCLAWPFLAWAISMTAVYARRSHAPPTNPNTTLNPMHAAVVDVCVADCQAASTLSVCSDTGVTCACLGACSSFEARQDPAGSDGEARQDDGAARLKIVKSCATAGQSFEDCCSRLSESVPYPVQCYTDGSLVLAAEAPKGEEPTCGPFTVIPAVSYVCQAIDAGIAIMDLFKKTPGDLTQEILDKLADIQRQLTLMEQNIVGKVALIVELSQLQRGMQAITDMSARLGVREDGTVANAVSQGDIADIYSAVSMVQSAAIGTGPTPQGYLPEYFNDARRNMMDVVDFAYKYTAIVSWIISGYHNCSLILRAAPTQTGEIRGEIRVIADHMHDILAHYGMVGLSSRATSVAEHMIFHVAIRSAKEPVPITIPGLRSCAQYPRSTSVCSDNPCPPTCYGADTPFGYLIGTVQNEDYLLSIHREAESLGLFGIDVIRPHLEGGNNMGFQGIRLNLASPTYFSFANRGDMSKVWKTVDQPLVYCSFSQGLSVYVGKCGDTFIFAQNDSASPDMRSPFVFPQ